MGRERAREPTDRTRAFALRLHAAIDHAKLPKDRKALAKALGISVAAVGQSLNGITAFGAATGAKAARLFGVNPLWLAEGTGPMVGEQPPPQQESPSALSARLADMPPEVRAAFETAMVNVIDALRPKKPSAAPPEPHEFEATFHHAKRNRSLAAKSPAPTRKP